MAPISRKPKQNMINAFSFYCQKSYTNAPSINAFKNRLDKHWKDEDIYYLDYKSEITRSQANRNVNDNRITNESGEEERIGSCAGNHH